MANRTEDYKVGEGEAFICSDKDCGKEFRVDSPYWFVWKVVRDDGSYFFRCPYCRARIYRA